jgi:hypothetical protein
VTWRAYRLARGRPSPQARLPWERKHQEGFDVYRLVVGGQLTFREAAARTGMATTTAWRRYWWFVDVAVYLMCRDLPRDHVPPQRATRECPAVSRRFATGLPVSTTRGPLCCAEPTVAMTAHRSGRWAIRGAPRCAPHTAGTPRRSAGRPPSGCGKPRRSTGHYAPGCATRICRCRTSERGCSPSTGRSFRDPMNTCTGHSGTGGLRSVPARRTAAPEP